MDNPANTIRNPQNGDLAFQVSSFENDNSFRSLQRHNYYSIILITKGTGQVKANFSECPFSALGLCCFSPYQPYLISGEGKIEGIAINFHPDYFCIYRHQNEVASNKILFDNIYQAPFFTINEEDGVRFFHLIAQMQAEMQKPELAQQELLVLHLKIFMINAIRIRTGGQKAKELVTKSRGPLVLRDLQEAIETNYKKKHTARAYADLLNISPKSLSRLVKTHFNKTLTGLISERIIMEAKSELYLTSKPVKTIAYTLGFSDEYYFSRFFKKNAEVSPQLFRDSVGFGREVLLAG